MTEPLVQTENLSQQFHMRTPGRTDVLHALDNVSLSIACGQTLGLVGESGCGKSTLGRCILRLLRPSSGRIVFAGTDITHMSRRALRPMRRRMQFIPQDPLASLNPRQTVTDALGEALTVHRICEKSTVPERIAALCQSVGLGTDIVNRYPHELSSGQRQRLLVARALSVEPDFIIADEPTSSLDVSVQAQVINLLLDLKESLRLTYLFISHDLHVVRIVSDVVAVMYLGRIVEVGSATDLYRSPNHPYTRVLLEPSQASDDVAADEPPNPLQQPSGCSFHPRCPIAKDICKNETPALRALGGDNVDRQVACHLA
ncbi:MAG: hypothetical protein A2289_18675 [Deltaproteobacteria bacterium RIFOXYA12_FULL_58_15]|nr:MAG: hypothetical protein A2289_18675 [Deltaproteobacteria bacterium RIFOXYA12_FULL_58_15]OGR14133.1 MAG: hypothetical protein A2341_15760 [Deltaproteobacteria bacterium RIFOXYB12_FULL_58_9]